MSVRKITKSHSSVTGFIQSVSTGRLHEHESLLERQLFVRLDIDPQVRVFEAQPLKIDYEGPDGKTRTYTPDVLVELAIPEKQKNLEGQLTDELLGGPAVEVILAEVKYKSDLERKVDELRPKFEAARRLADKRGWRFEVFTEETIITSFFENAKFLRSYAKEPVTGAMGNVNLAHEIAQQIGETSAQSLAEALLKETSSENDEASKETPSDVLPFLWRLVAQRLLGADLYSGPLSEETRVWATPEKEAEHTQLYKVPTVTPEERQRELAERYNLPDEAKDPDRLFHLPKNGEIDPGAVLPDKRNSRSQGRDPFGPDSLLEGHETADPKKSPGFIDFGHGNEVSYKGELFIVESHIKSDTVLAFNVARERLTTLLVEGLRPPEEAQIETRDEDKEGKDDQEVRARHLPDVSEKEWQEALRKYRAIKPLLAVGERIPNARIEERAKEEREREGGLNKSARTLRRYINRFRDGGSRVSALLRKKRKDAGTRRKSDLAESLIRKGIAELFLNDDRNSTEFVCEKVKEWCSKKGIKISKPTIRSRIEDIPEERKMRARYGRKVARDKFRVIQDNHEADYPGQIVQIDHTKMDLLVVNRRNGKVLRHPWITLCIDVFSRMVTGFFISLDNPSTLTTGLALVNSILPKEKYLRAMDAEVEWPVWGTPDTLGADNAKEFKGKMLRRACQEYGIELKHRPVKHPRYGGHVERGFSTYMSKIHQLEGTTWGSVPQRGEYDSEGRAKYSLGWAKKYFTRYIVEEYHQRPHRGLGGLSPLRVWNEATYGDSLALGGSEIKGRRGPARRPTNERKIALDFMPYEKRVIRKRAVTIEEISYWDSEILKDFRSRTDENGNSFKFLFRRDPHDITRVWFFNPDEEIYQCITTKKKRPSMSIWEMRAAKKEAKRNSPSGKATEERIFRARERQIEMEKQGFGSGEEGLEERRRSYDRARDLEEKIDKGTTEVNGGPDLKPASKANDAAETDTASSSSTSTSKETEAEGSDVEPFDTDDFY